MHCNTVHAVPELRIAAGRLGVGVSVLMEQSTHLDQGKIWQPLRLSAILG